MRGEALDMQLEAKDFRVGKHHHDDALALASASELQVEVVSYVISDAHTTTVWRT